jgi:hypothetical protein
MKFRRAALLSSIAAISSFGSAPLWAQDAPTAAPDAAQAGQPDHDNAALNDDDQIIVLAQRLHGEVEAPQPPLQVLGTEDIAAYGASSLADLLQALTPQTTSGRGRGGGQPALLVNGMRVSSFREIQSYPPEAIEKIEILPEEVALRYGYSADQRVINIILKNNYSSTTLEREYGQPFQGGFSTQQLDLTYLKIAGSNRLNLNAQAEHNSALTESERDIVQPDSLIPTVAGDPDPAAQRLLREPETTLGLNGTYTMPVGGAGGSLALNAAVSTNRHKDRDGYNIVLLTDAGGDSERRVVNPDFVLTELNKSTTFSAGATLNHPLGSWDLTATADGSIAKAKVVTDRPLDLSDLLADALAGDFPIDGTLPVLPNAGADLANTTTTTLNTLATARGNLFFMPAGDVSATLRTGYNLTDYESSDTGSGFDVALKRNVLTGGVNIGIPLTSRRENFLSAIGDLSLNFSAGVDHLSDFGTLVDWTAGVTWAPTEKLNLQATYLYNENAPGLTQLGAPTVVRQNVAVYDFTNNATALITTTSGGNPSLVAETRKDWRFSAQWELPFVENARLQVEYFRNRSFDITQGFPSILTPEIEAAFPGRVTRDSDGTLLALDLRPVNYAGQASKRLRWGINFGGALGKARQQAPAADGGAGGQGGAGAAASGGQGASAVGPNGPQFTGGQGAAPGGAPGGQGGFNPAAFQALRDRLCAAGQDESTLDPEIVAALPEPLRARLTGADGQLDPEKIKEFKSRICSANGPVIVGGPGGPGQGGGQGFDPARFAAIRQRLCATEGDAIPDLSDLPEFMLARIRDDKGAIDPAKYKEFKTQFCSATPGQPGQGGQPGGGGFVFFGGPPPGGGAGGPPPGGGGFGGPGGGGGFALRGLGGGGPGGGNDGRGRFFVNLFHTIELQNELTIAPGLPVLDLLDGDALSGGGTVRHSVELEGGMFYRGKGMRISGRYTGPSHVDGSGLPGSTDLRFGSLFTLDLRLFVDLGQQEKLVEKFKILKGSRISFNIDNLFDSYRTVTDSTGAIPLRYQRDLTDPVGRSFEIEFRKIF